jgi:hypothetical protein
MSSVENMNTHANVNTTDFERLERNTADFIERSKEEIATPPLQAFLDATTERIMKQFMKTFGFQLVEQFRTAYDIEDSIEEISKKVGLDDVSVTRAKATKKTTTTTKAKTTTKKTAAPKWEKPSVPLPWTGERLADPATCLAIRPTQNLFSQCVNKKEGDGMYCKTCQKQADKNETGKPNAGDVLDREAGDLFEYTPPGADKPRKVQQYGNILEKAEKKAADKGEDTSKFSRENVELEATMFGLTIPEEFWAVKKAKRGRKSKDSDSDGSESDAEAKMEKASGSLLDAIQSEDDAEGKPVQVVETKAPEAVEEDKEMPELETFEPVGEEETNHGAEFGYDSDVMPTETKKTAAAEQATSDTDSDAETSKKEKSKDKKETKKKAKKISKREKKAKLGKYEIKLARNDEGERVMLVTLDGNTNEVEGKYSIKDGKLYDEDKDEVTEEMIDDAFKE